VSEYHKYIQELRAELKHMHRERDRIVRDLNMLEFVVARLQHDRDRDQEIIMDLAETEIDEAIQQIEETNG